MTSSAHGLRPSTFHPAFSSPDTGTSNYLDAGALYSLAWISEQICGTPSPILTCTEPLKDESSGYFIKQVISGKQRG